MSHWQRRALGVTAVILGITLPGFAGAQTLADLPELMPWFAPQSTIGGLALMALTLAAALAAVVLRRAADPLPEQGVLPELLRNSAAVARLLTLVLALGVAAAWVPARIAPALPWVVLTGAVAVGWSARDILPDLMAWLFMVIEGHVRPGTWVAASGHDGRVIGIGLRSTRLRTSSGEEVILPNRLFISEPVRRTGRWPSVEVTLVIDADHPADDVRRALMEAAMLAPWTAPRRPEVSQSPESPSTWRLRVHLLDGRFVQTFRGTIRERALEVLDRQSAGALHEAMLPPQATDA